MLHGQRRPTFLNTVHCILERVDLLEVEAVSIIEEHRLEELRHTDDELGEVALGTFRRAVAAAQVAS